MYGINIPGEHEPDIMTNGGDRTGTVRKSGSGLIVLKIEKQCQVGNICLNSINFD